MKTRLFATLLAIAALGAAPAFAHSAMMETSIEDNAKLSQAPTEFRVTFEHESALTSMMLMTADKKMLALDFEPSTELGTEFVVPLPALTNGGYTLSWRSLAKDGHAMPGAVRFTVTGN